MTLVGAGTGLAELAPLDSRPAVVLNVGAGILVREEVVPAVHMDAVVRANEGRLAPSSRSSSGGSYRTGRRRA